MILLLLSSSSAISVIFLKENCRITHFVSARTIGVDVEKESQSPVRRTLVVVGGASESLYSNGNNLSRSESSSSDSVNSQDGNIQVILHNVMPNKPRHGHF